MGNRRSSSNQDNPQLKKCHNCVLVAERKVAERNTKILAIAHAKTIDELNKKQRVNLPFATTTKAGAAAAHRQGDK